jgi:lysophospholipase L1-like esterase
MKEALGFRRYHVIEEGLGGRTTVREDPIDGHKNGKEYLIPCLATHSPLDLVIIMLGTNDLKYRFCATAQDIAAGAGIRVDIVNKSGTVKNPKTPKVLLLVSQALKMLEYKRINCKPIVSAVMPLADVQQPFNFCIRAKTRW